VQLNVLVVTSNKVAVGCIAAARMAAVPVAAVRKVAVGCIAAVLVAAVRKAVAYSPWGTHQLVAGAHTQSDQFSNALGTRSGRSRQGKQGTAT
jgi:hypothetical protein